MKFIVSLSGNLEVDLSDTQLEEIILEHLEAEPGLEGLGDLYIDNIEAV